MKKYVAIVVAVLFVFTTAGLCFAQATPNETAPGSTLPAKPAPPMKKTDAQKDRQKMTPDKEKAYKAPAVAEGQAKPDTTKAKKSKAQKDRQKMTPAKEKASQAPPVAEGQAAPPAAPAKK